MIRRGMLGKCQIEFSQRRQHRVAGRHTGLSLVVIVAAQLALMTAVPWLESALTQLFL